MKATDREATIHTDLHHEIDSVQTHGARKEGMDAGMREEMKEEKTLTHTCLLQALELRDHEAALRPSVAGQERRQTEEKTCSPTEDHHLVVIPHGGHHQEDVHDHRLEEELAVHPRLRDFETSRPNLADARQSVNVGFLQTGVEMHAIDHH